MSKLLVLCLLSTVTLCSSVLSFDMLEDMLADIGQRVSRMDTRDHEDDIVCVYSDRENPFFPSTPFTTGEAFLEETGFNGSQRIIFGIFDYTVISQFFIMSSFVDFDAIHVFVIWEEGQNIFQLENLEDYPGDYNLRMEKVEPTAQYVENMINDISSTGTTVDPSKVEFFTSGLGSQVAALVGSSIQGIGTIIAFEPAGAGYQYAPISSKLDQTDANYVSVIRANADEFAMTGPVGHTDFHLVADGPLDNFNFGGRYLFTPFFIGGPNAVRSLVKQQPPSVDTIRDIFRSLLARGYKCNGKSKFKGGKCFEDYAPIPLFPFMVNPELDAGVFYHLLSSLDTNDYNGSLSLNQNYLYESDSIATAGLQIQIMTRTLSNRNEGLVEANIVFPNLLMVQGETFDTPPQFQAYETGFKPIVESNKASPGFTYQLFSVPFVPSSSFFSNFTVTLRYRPTVSHLPPFYFERITVSLPHMVAQDDFGTPTIVDATFYKCGVTFPVAMELELTLEDYGVTC